jgi:hypothetical protein
MMIGMQIDLEFNGPIWEWRGAAPGYLAWIGGSEWATSLWPKDGLYVLPLKLMIRKAEALQEGDVVAVRLTASGSG